MEDAEKPPRSLLSPKVALDRLGNEMERLKGVCIISSSGKDSMQVRILPVVPRRF